MTLTLLLDLDNTLLDNEMGTFIPAYLQALGNHLKSFIAPEIMVPALLEATQKMLRNRSPDRSLKQVFDGTFYPSIGFDLGALQEPIADFYEQEFPKLRQLTRFRPEAVELIEESLERGFELALATNPLFPRTAILQRMEWAGLPLDKYPFLLVPSYETFSFAKPNPEFFAELLGRLGWPDDQVLMVGDDLDNDIQPAQGLGIPTFWVSEHTPLRTGSNVNAHGAGNLDDLLPWLSSLPENNFHPAFEQQKALQTIIRSTPAVLIALTSGLDQSDWLTEPRPGEWSLTEIICHLRDVDADVNLPRVRKMLDGSNPFLPGIDTDRWAEERLYYCQDGRSALNDFIRNRSELLDILEGLEPDDWDRPARHAIFGPTYLREQVGIIAGHDKLHVRQAHQALGEITIMRAQ